MKQFISTLSLFILISTSLISQTNPYKLGIDCLEDNGYYNAISQLENKKEVYINSPQFRTAYYQIISTVYSFVGKDSLAFQSFDKAFSNEESRNKVSVFDTSAILTDIEFLNAFDFIDSISSKHRLIIINESHHTSQHRILTKEVLANLKKNGFNFLGVEALSPLDTNLMERGYPSVGKTGFYINEPVFGNLIREGIKEDYTIFPYDLRFECDYNEKRPNYCKNLRELIQATAIAKILNNNPESKVIIHCGYDHLFEKTETDWIKMAEYLNIITGIDPFTVSQTKYIERGYPSLEKNEYAALTEKANMEVPFICFFMGEVWNPKGYDGLYDAQVFWPNITYQNERPQYLTSQKGFSRYYIPSNRLKPNTIIQAFLKNELIKPVPIDQVIIDEIEKIYALILPKGEFTIIVKDKEGSTIDQFDIEQ